jgi:hypothetical protein
MTRRYKEGILPFKIVPCNEPLVARSGLVLPYEMAKALHTMNNTREAFRLIVIRWPKLQTELFDSSSYFYHALATNWEEEALEVIKLHNQRGQVENYIKELKTGFGMEWYSANSVCGATS